MNPEDLPRPELLAHNIEIMRVWLVGDEKDAGSLSVIVQPAAFVDHEHPRGGPSLWGVTLADIARDVASALAHEFTSLDKGIALAQIARFFNDEIVSPTGAAVTERMVKSGLDEPTETDAPETSIATDPRIRHQRTHERLQESITRDPIFLFQERRYWCSEAMPYEWDEDENIFRDGKEEVSRDRLIKEGYATTYWNTVGVFLTLEDGEEHGNAKAHRYPDGWRVYCIAVDGDLVHVLAAATVGGRYG